MDADRMWSLWYQLSEARRAALVRQYGSAWAAAWALYGG